jgi:ubiquinone/menaquinone biosynthesis C-methylase UbiE
MKANTLKRDKRINESAFEKLELLNRNHVLEVGMGEGSVVPFIFRRKEDLWYTGLDISEGQLRVAAERSRGLTAIGRVSIVRGSIDALPFPHGSFDGICSVNTLYHWPDRFKGMSELFRVLNASGRLVVAVRSAEIVSSTDSNVYTYKKYSREAVLDLMRSAGFETVWVDDLDGSSGTAHEVPYESKGIYFLGDKR